MADAKSIEMRLISIEGRNEKVESDKAWETSWARRGLISIFTYLAIAMYFYAINLANPWANAIVPAAGFLLSTLTLPFFRKLWLENIHKK